MKIIIAGASAIGSHLARLLSRSNQDIVLIDENADKLGDISSNYDLMTLVGEATNPKTLRSAGVPALPEHRHIQGTAGKTAKS